MSFLFRELNVSGVVVRIWDIFTGIYIGIFLLLVVSVRWCFASLDVCGCKLIKSSRANFFCCIDIIQNG